MLHLHWKMLSILYLPIIPLRSLYTFYLFIHFKQQLHVGYLFFIMDSIYLIRFKNLKIDQNIPVYIITVLTKVLFLIK